MSMLRIRVRGSGIQPYIAGAYLTRWCHGRTARVTIDCASEPDSEQPILLRPSFHRFHAEIGLSAEDLDRLGCFAATTTKVSESIALPFEPYGLPRTGVDFHQHWLRGRTLGEHADISAYSPSYALARFSPRISCRDAERMPFETGLSVETSRYAELLKDRVVRLDGTFAEGNESADADLTFICGTDSHATVWKGNTIDIASRSRIPGISAHMALEAARRWLSLSAKPGESEPEEREFNRLSDAEAERIADMEALIFPDDPAAVTRPGLARKISVFKACGRIPLEDYEVFAQHEWLAALLARGLVPARHDRLANAMPESELLQWLADLRRKLAPRSEDA